MANVSGSSNVSNLGSPNATFNSSTAYAACTVRTVDEVGRVALASFAVFVGILLICENILLFHVIARTRALHSNTNILVASLAITDVLVGAHVCLMGLAEQPGGLRSWLGLSPKEIRIFDSFVTGLNFSLVTVSICHLSALALDRYLYVLWPLHYHIRVTRRRVLATTALLWTLGFVYFTVAIVVFRSPKYHIDCLIWETPAEYGTWPLTAVYLLCMCIVFVSTIGIAKIALKHKRKKPRKMLPRNTRLCCHTVRCNTVEDNCTHTRSTRQSLQLSKNDHGLQNASTTVLASSARASPTSKGATNGIELLEHDRSPNRHENGNALSVFQADTSSSDNHLWTHGAQSREILTSALGNNTKQELVLELSNNSQTSHQNYERAGIQLTNAYLGECTKETPPVYKTNLNKHKTSDVSKNVTVAVNGHTPIRVQKFDVESNNQAKDRRLSNQENMKIIKFVLVMCGCFLLCTFVPLLSFLIQSFDPSLPFPEKFAPTMFIMLGSNSGMNFFIITFMNKEFRLALIQTLSCCRVVCSHRDCSSICRHQ